jgi:hypothetical protein
MFYNTGLLDCNYQFLKCYNGYYGLYAGFSDILSLNMAHIQIDVAFAMNHQPDVITHGIHVDGFSESGHGSRFSIGDIFLQRPLIFSIYYFKWLPFN